jgi:hypothetical protein
MHKHTIFKGAPGARFATFIRTTGKARARRARAGLALFAVISLVECAVGKPTMPVCMSIVTSVGQMLN